MEVRLSSRALVRPALSVEPSSCRTIFLSENWPFQCAEEIKLANENRTNLAFTTTAALIVKPNGIRLGTTLA